MRSVACLLLAVGAHAVDLAGNRPVSKVLTLLKDMSDTLEKEAAEDQAIYDKMVCWCTTNDAAKVKSIADAETHIKNLGTKIEELTALSAQLNEEIGTLSAEVAKNQKALKTATTMREEELAAFGEEESATMDSISSLGGALDALQKHQAASFMQVASALKKATAKHPALLQTALSPSERDAASAFIDSADLGFFTQTSSGEGAAPGDGNSYSSQSGQIFGILEQMKETFEADLAGARKDEMAAQKAYEELKAAKEKEIAAGEAQIATKTQELADTDEANAQAKIDLEDTKNTMAADQEYLAKLKEQCALTDKEFEERVKTRQLEMQAVSKATGVLSSDDAMDLMSKTFSLVQTSMTKSSERRSQASNVLMSAAHRMQSPRLAALAMSVRLDAFTKVKKAIEDLIAQLLQDKADEIKHKDFCTEELNTNQLQTEEKTRQKTDLLSHMEDLTMKIADLTKAIATLKSEVGDLQLSLKRAGEDREAQSKAFQQLVTEQRGAQKLLKAALEILSEFYFIQQEPAGPPPPGGFKPMKKNAQSGGVMSMIEQIIADAKAMEEEALKAEKEAIGAYEVTVAETKASVDEKAKDIATKQGTKAKLEEELVETTKDKDEVVVELEDLSKYNAELHTSCDYVLKNFDIRQKARDEEVEALKQAKAILSGAKFSAFLQQA
jgi:chromosome segregation ATPase